MKRQTETKSSSAFKSNVKKIFEKVIADREKYYLKNPDYASSPSNTQSIIEKYANYNTGIAATAGLIPGPLGFAGAVAEMALIIKNQLLMIYDIAHAHGKQEYVDNDLLAAIFLASLDGTKVTLFTLQEDYIVVRKADTKFLNSMIIEIAKRVAMRFARSMICRFLPILGAGAMAVYSRYSTVRMGKFANSFWEKKVTYAEPDDNEPEIIDLPENSPLEDDLLQPETNYLHDIDQANTELESLSDDNISDIQHNSETEVKNEISDLTLNASAQIIEPPLVQDNKVDESIPQPEKIPEIIVPDTNNLQELKIMAMITLMKIDGDIDERETNYVEKIIEMCDLPDEIKDNLLTNIHSITKYEIDFHKFKRSRSESLGLLVDMVTLTRRDEIIRDEEVAYLRKIAKAIGVSTYNLDSMLRY